MRARRNKRLPDSTLVHQKRLPPNVIENVLPPDKKYHYFKDHQENRFEYNAPYEFKLVNAWWLADAAFLAYTEPQFAERRFKAAGFPHCKFFSCSSTQCYVVHNDNFVIVAFRGSEIRQREGTSGCDLRYIVADWLTDLDTYLVDVGQNYFVHEGFKKALDEIWDPQPQANEEECRDSLKSYLDTVGNKNGRQRPIWFTGHSLGAALATLAAGRYENVAGLYTFGSPRVGVRAFAKALKVPNYRFVNNDDVVAKVPFHGDYRGGNIFRNLFFGWYHHIGNTLYIDQEDIIHVNPHIWNRLLWNFRKMLKNMGNCVFLLLRFRRELPENALTDHAPIYYAIRIWNNYIRGSGDLPE